MKRKVFIKKNVKRTLKWMYAQFCQVWADSSLKFLLLFVAIFLLLFKIWYPIYQDFVILPILGKIESIDRNSLVFFIIAILYMGISVNRVFIKKARIGFTFYLFISFAFIIYLSFCFKETYCFAHFTIFHLNAFRYVDVLALIWGIHSVEFVTGLFKKYGKPKFNSNPFIVDAPLGSGSGDRFGRKQFAIELAAKITSKISSKKSMAIAIDGAWGSGKTSFLKMIREQIENDRVVSNRIIVDFHPWKSRTPEQIITDFFDQLTDEIKKYDPKLSRKILSYSRTISRLDDGFLSKAMDSIVDYFDEDATKGDRFYRINKSIEELGKQIIIFIDDLDRLDKKEIIEVIRLIRNTASFTDTVFVAAYEREYVLNALAELNEHNYRFFLEKIFQYEFILPGFEKTILINDLYVLAAPSLLEDHKGVFNALLNTHLVVAIQRGPNYFGRYIKSYRDVYRYLNSFLFTYQFIKSEINIEDFAIIELLKLKYPEVYEVLYEKQTEFFSINNSTNFPSTREYVLIDANNNFPFKEYLENCHPIKYSKCDLEDLISIIKMLFGNDPLRPRSSKNDEKSIAISDNFYKYFTGRVFAGEISIEEFNIEFSKPLNQFLQTIDKWVEAGFLNDIMIRLLRKSFVDLKTREHYEKFILSIFHFCSKTSVGGTKYLYDTEKLYKLTNNRKDSDFIRMYYEGKFDAYLNFIKSVFKQAKEPFLFESWFIRVIKERFRGDYIISLGELDEFQVDYFKQYLSSKKDFDGNTWALIFDARTIEEFNRTGDSFQERKVPNSRISSLFIDFIIRKKLIDKFLYTLIRPEPFEKVLVGLNYDLINAIFGSDLEFEKFLFRIKEGAATSVYLEEFMLFRQQLVNSGFVWQYFDFKTIPFKKEDLI